ncbi:MAG: hypothetical protein U5J63_10165 [Fodinibius sp.]|nr:hypothetical protein [Fodinibius sp.]
MIELIETARLWFFGLGEQYGVNPIIFGSIYVGAIPFFTLSIAWMIRNSRYDKSIVLPALAATFFFVSAYLYLIIEGENVPWWVYGIVAVLVAYGARTTFKSIRKKVNKLDKEIIRNE